MAITKKQRQQVWDKSNGNCWYCGADLPERGWRVDHKDPVYRQDGEMWNPQNDVIENMVPACAPCNIFKSVFTVEEFRHEIEKQTERALKSSVNFRTALRFGMIEETNEPAVFWFEHKGL